MAKKFIDIMDTTFRDGFQSVYGGRVLMDDFFPAVEAAKIAGINHFEFGGGARFQSSYFYLKEDAFIMMDKFRKIVGEDANLQTLARGVNTVMLDTGSKELIDLHAKMFKKHGTTTIRNFDALNDIENLKYSGERIVHHGMNHEIVITMMELPPGCSGAHNVAFYEKKLREILDSGIPYHSICFKDASGTSNPRKVYETIKMARGLIPEDMHLRLHTHETAGVSVSAYMAALEAGVDGIDLAAAPVSGGTSQPDILTMLHATKGLDYDLGGLEIDKVLTYEKELHACLEDYFLPPEATTVSPIIQFSPMPGGALTANTQMMRENDIMDKFPDVIAAMTEVVEKGGHGTSVTPVSQFYFQQALENVLKGPWEEISPGYGKMVLGYFGKTPIEPDPEVVRLASEHLGLEPTTKNALELADEDDTKSLFSWINRLKEEDIEITEENIFIAAACHDKGIEFLKGNAELHISKISQMEKDCKGSSNMGSGNYTVVVDGQKFSVQVAEGDADIQVTQIETSQSVAQTPSVDNAPISSGSDVEIKALLPGNVWKIVMNPGDNVNEGDVIMILESMKMEIDVVASQSGIIKTINVATNDKVVEGQVVAVIG
jgi:pyruvate carboxylase subunit B